MLRRTLKVYVRSGGDLVVLVVALISMHFQGAPGWALTLALVIGTRASMIATAIDLRELQANIRKTREETEPKPRR